MSAERLRLEDGPRAAVRRAAAVLNAGGVAVFPTDTVYGLFAAATSLIAYRRIFELKQRPADKALALLARAGHPLASLALDLLGGFADEQRSFRGGGLTLLIDDELVPAAAVPSEVRRLQPGRIGVRVPAHAAVQALLRALGGLAWATSANASRDAPPATADQVESWLATLAEPPELVVTSRKALAGRPSDLALLHGERLLFLER